MKLNFNLREPSSKKETPIKLIVRWNNKRLVYPTKITIKPALWNYKLQRVRTLENFQHSCFKSANAINSQIASVEVSAKAVWERMQFNNDINPDQFRDQLDIELNRKAKPFATFIKFFEEFVESGEDRISKRSKKYISKNTSNQIKTLFNVMRDYVNREKIDFKDFEKDIYYSTFSDITEYLIKDKGYSHNTIATYIKNLKVVFDAAFERKLMQSNKFKQFTFSFEDTDSIALTPDQLNAIYSLDLAHNPSLERQRDLFIIGCWTALRYSDLVRIRPEHIETNFIKISTVKSDEKVVIPIIDQVREILVKYDYKLPKGYSSQKFNEAIKQFCKLIPALHDQVEFKRTIAGKTTVFSKPKWQVCSSHTCRRSACTNFYKMGIPVSMIMKISGHASERNFFKYIKIEKEEAAEFVFKRIKLLNKEVV